MDWSNVTYEEVLDALQEVDWKQPPRPLSTFFAKFGPPKNRSKWESRLKCNLYYYRTNYLIIITTSFVFFYIRNIGALLALVIGLFALLCANNSFAQMLDEILSPLFGLRAQKKNSSGSSSSKKEVTVVGVPRKVVVSFFSAIFSFLMWWSNGLLTLSLAMVFGLGFMLLHASFRIPNFKARLQSANAEFKAVWRGYQSEYARDFNL
eukprot:TRINITY_DN11994_c1_g1_i12.p1 TRINITY_DN11994_c1_g1~~TRINITY_DN11994_c1_g1_i12.p1  ORF type:complete len:207 (+),score=9.81 TRINITY_DN11994_c1_g1_i12:155-775(+)